MKKLRELYEEHTGKVSDKWDIYLSEYDRVFIPYRNEEINLLEIGVQNGGSLEIWSKYFPKAKKFIGCDINEDCKILRYEDPRINVIVDDANTDIAENQIVAISDNFDIIIDDGSHTSEDIIKTFCRYFNYLNNDGVFIAEDLHCSYWQEYQGGLHDPYSSIAFFKSLADITNYEHWGIKNTHIDYLSLFSGHYDFDLSHVDFSKIHSIEFVNSICIIRKKTPESNVLGERFLTGHDDQVISGLHQFEKHHTVPEQKNNKYSNFNVHPVEELLSLKIQNEALKSQHEDLKVRIYEFEKTIKDIISSTSWKVTFPLRWIMHKLRRAIHLFKIAPQIFSRIGGITDTYVKVRHYYSIGGKKLLKEKVLTSFRKQRNTPHTLNEVSTEEVQYRIDKLPNISSDSDVLIFVAYSPSGKLSRLQVEQVNNYADAGYTVLLVINSADYSNEVFPGESKSHGLMVRENVGYDFRGWADALRVFGGLGTVNSISFSNDSLFPICNVADLDSQRKKINSLSQDIVFLTQNNEVKTHFQSYFFCIKRAAIKEGALNVILNTISYEDKDRLIHEVEIDLSNTFSKYANGVTTLYSISNKSHLNPTIHHWKELLDIGFPYLKIQLFTSGIYDLNSPDFDKILNKEQRLLLREHCSSRKVIQCSKSRDKNKPAQKAIPISKLYNDHGAQQAFNIAPEQIPTVILPFKDINSKIQPHPKVLAVIHCYYLDVALTILEECSALNVNFRFLLTTDTEIKKEKLEEFLNKYKMNANVIVCPNRGRDVAPFIIEGNKHLEDAELVLHLHTKKSPHDSVYSGWGKFLRENLIGTKETIASIFKIFESSDIGVIYSEHYPPVKDLRNWGYDYTHAHKILNKLDIELSADSLLEFPTSTMFWAHRSALTPLFSLGLKYEDFEPEYGQTDGTFAHAIERCILLVSENQGYRNLKVLSENNYQTGNAVMKLNVNDIPYMLKRAGARLLGSIGLTSTFYNSVGEIYPVNVTVSKNPRTRFNLILPTMKPEKIYGGITTALTVANSLIEHLSENLDIRVIITSDSVDRSSVEELSNRLGRNFTLISPEEDLEGNAIVNLAERRHIPLTIRANELFFATAWWTADLAFRMVSRQKDIHNTSNPVVYLIQDYEPGFYPWSNKYALSEATYHHADETIALMNSEELSEFMNQRYSFRESYCIPYEVNKKIASLLTSSLKERIILVYGRPTVARNCFELIVEGIRIWQARLPAANCEFKVIFAGENFNKKLISELENAEVVGKLPIEEYADLLNKSAIGISLMISPHPSYPPLEMASAGCFTITNSYEGKDLTKRASNIISLNHLTPEAIANSLDLVVKRSNFDAKTELVNLTALNAKFNKIDYLGLAQKIYR